MSDFVSQFSKLLMNNADTIQGLLGDQADKKNITTASAAAIPALMEALKQNSNTAEGAASLTSALEQHDGSKLGNIGDLLKGFETENGAGILKHILGGNQENLAASISQKSGLAPENSTKLLAMLAPVIMQFLGREKQANNLDASGVSDLTTQLSSMLGGSDGSGLMGMVSGLLDQNKDGSIVDDVLGLVTGFFGKK